MQRPQTVSREGHVLVAHRPRCRQPQPSYTPFSATSSPPPLLLVLQQPPEVLVPVLRHPLLRTPDSLDAIELVDDECREALLAILGPPHHLVLQPVVLPVVGIDRLPACRQRKSQHGNSKHQENRQQDIHQRQRYPGSAGMPSS